MHKNILITGGAGYVGTMLAHKLVSENKKVIIYDTFWYGDEKNLFNEVLDKIKIVKADIRNPVSFEAAIKENNVDCVIHLACVSNDPSYELNPDLGKSINFDCFEDLIKISKDNGVKRFIYASSSSVYGVKEEEQVTENLSLEPLTDYSKYKALCEEILQKYIDKNFTGMIVRPATVCGYSKRLRLDLSVNILTTHAYFKNKITIFGGEQYRPNLNILDMIEFYVEALKYDSNLINGEIFNVGYENLKIKDIAQKVKRIVKKNIEMETTPSNDNRSYRITAKKIEERLGFVPKHTVEDAINSLYQNFEKQVIQNPFESELYYNVQVMKKIYENKK
tara:strand:- start:808 stop:1812 length:1005 start_codon:yes stop_codon:yes gene_type:complete